MLLFAKTIPKKCSDLPELCPELVELNVAFRMKFEKKQANSNNAIRTDQLIKPQIFKSGLDW